MIAILRIHKYKNNTFYYILQQHIFFVCRLCDIHTIWSNMDWIRSAVLFCALDTFLFYSRQTLTYALFSLPSLPLFIFGTLPITPFAYGAFEIRLHVNFLSDQSPYSTKAAQHKSHDGMSNSATWIQVISRFCFGPSFGVFVNNLF